MTFLPHLFFCQIPCTKFSFFFYCWVFFIRPMAFMHYNNNKILRSPLPLACLYLYNEVMIFINITVWVFEYIFSICLASFFEEEEIISPGICCTKYVLLPIFSPAITILMGSFESCLRVHFHLFCPSGLCLSVITDKVVLILILKKLNLFINQVLICSKVDFEKLKRKFLYSPLL